MHDWDKKFRAKVDDAFQAADIRVLKSAFRSPNTNAFVERFIQTLQRECLDHFVVFGEQHMDHLVNEFVVFYHEERPHRGKENELLTPGESQPDVLSIGSVTCSERLGGVFKHYHLPVQNPLREKFSATVLTESDRSQQVTDSASFSVPL